MQKPYRGPRLNSPYQGPFKWDRNAIRKKKFLLLNLKKEDKSMDAYSKEDKAEWLPHNLKWIGERFWDL